MPRPSHPRTTACLGLCLLLGWLGTACIDPVVRLGDPDPEFRQVVDIPPNIQHDLDVLFVVDTSEGMVAKQAELNEAFERLVSILNFHDGGRPNLHIGVISSDMGGAAAGCTAAGDQGRLHTEADLCGVSEPFIEDLRADVDDETGGRITNFEGDLASVFACTSFLGDTGCPYEQPLEAMRAALDGSRFENIGFLRDHATLAVIFVSTEDDCSAELPQFYDPSFTDPTDNPKFRCFREATQCVNSGDVEGRLEACRPQESPRFLYDIDEYISFLTARKGRDKVVVGGLIGTSDLAQLETSPQGGLQLADTSCNGATENYPAVRLGGVLDAFTHSAASAACGDATPNALAPMGREIRKTLGTSCLEGHIADDNPAYPGVQPQCRVWAEHADGTREPIPACPVPEHLRETSPVVPCHVIQPAGPCGDFRSQLKLDVWWGYASDSSSVERSQPVDVHVIGECVLQDDSYEPLPIATTVE